MKKTLVSILAAITIIASSTAGISSMKAKACSLPECQNLFTDTLNGLLDENNVQEAEVSYVTEKIYDMSLNELGCLYDFTVDEVSGFAIMIYYEGQFDVSEIYLDSVNPYKDCSGVKIYPVTLLYLYYSNGHFYDTVTNLPYTNESVETISDEAFCGGEAEVVYNNHRVYYTYRTDLASDRYLLCGQHPDYIGISGINNICVAIAASNIIGYWDRFKPNLIPYYEPGELWNGIYFYGGDHGPADECTRQLATDMNGGNGTTVAECKSGMTKYCNRAGYTITYTSLMSWGSFSYNNAKNKLLSGQPIMIFSEGFSAYEVVAGSTGEYDIYLGITCVANHAMAGFGYMSVAYTLTDGSVEQADFIRVSTGQSLQSSGYFNTRIHKINDAFSVKIS